MEIKNKYFCVEKNGKNEFANFSYRTLDDIFEILKKNGVSVNLRNELVLGSVPYIKVTATDEETGRVCEGFALLDKHFKGSAEQLTGSATTYATKYALCSLYCISNGQDPDEKDNSKKEHEWKSVKELENENKN